MNDQKCFLPELIRIRIVPGDVDGKNPGGSFEKCRNEDEEE